MHLGRIRNSVVLDARLELQTLLCWLCTPFASPEPPLHFSPLLFAVPGQWVLCGAAASLSPAATRIKTAGQPQPSIWGSTSTSDAPVNAEVASHAARPAWR